MSEEDFINDEEEIITTMEGSCFGEYGQHYFCETCSLSEKCKKFTAIEKEISIRSKGKYTGKGKEVRKERY